MKNLLCIKYITASPTSCTQFGWTQHQRSLSQSHSQQWTTKPAQCTTKCIKRPISYLHYILCIQWTFVSFLTCCKLRDKSDLFLCTLLWGTFGLSDVMQPLSRKMSLLLSWLNSQIKRTQILLVWHILWTNNVFPGLTDISATVELLQINVLEAKSTQCYKMYFFLSSANVVFANIDYYHMIYMFITIWALQVASAVYILKDDKKLNQVNIHRYINSRIRYATH